MTDLRKAWYVVYFGRRFRDSHQQTIPLVAMIATTAMAVAIYVSLLELSFSGIGVSGVNVSGTAMVDTFIVVVLRVVVALVVFVVLCVIVVGLRVVVVPVVVFGGGGGLVTVVVVVTGRGGRQRGGSGGSGCPGSTLQFWTSQYAVQRGSSTQSHSSPSSCMLLPQMLITEHLRGGSALQCRCWNMSLNAFSEQSDHSFEPYACAFMRQLFFTRPSPSRPP